MLQIKTQTRVTQEAQAEQQRIERSLERVIAAAAAGKLDQRVQPADLPPQLAGTARELNRLLDTLQSMQRDMVNMSHEHARGDIDVVIDSQRYAGDFGEMARGINEMVGAHIAVKKLAMGVVAEFGRGNFDAPLDPLPGKKAFINDTIETVRGNLKGLIAQMNHMSAEHARGDIDVVIDAARFDGDFRTMAQGVNDMVGAHIAVKKLAMGVISEFGRGNFDAPLDRLPGKKAFIDRKSVV
jgi:methyl-accepting chemotaxis protein